MNINIKKNVVLVILFLTLVQSVTSLDTDRDGIPDYLDKFPADFDNDGITDMWEVSNNLKFDTYDSFLDSDGDRLTNLEEFKAKTDPNNPDTDNDGFSDYIEVKKMNTDPLVENKVVWPFYVFPPLIILFIIFLFLIDKYGLHFSKLFGVLSRHSHANKPIIDAIPKTMSDREKQQRVFRDAQVNLQSRKQKGRALMQRSFGSVQKAPSSGKVKRFSKLSSFESKPRQKESTSFDALRSVAKKK